MSAPSLACSLFDGRLPQAQAVMLHVEGGQLCIEGEGLSRRLPVTDLRWPERQRHGPRQLLLPDGGLIVHEDGPGWDGWAQASGMQENPAGRIIGSWRLVLLATLLAMACVGAAWAWGIPAAATRIVAALPASADEALGETLLASLDDQLLRPSELSTDHRARIQATLEAAVQADPAERVSWRLHFRASAHAALGPNALALPGGHIVLTDDLVRLLEDAPDVLTGVLAHELGHVRRRHGMQSLVRSAFVAALVGLIVGDVSSLITTGSVVVGELAYSRDHEREADAEARRTLVAAGLDPVRMALLFERLDAWAREHPQVSRTLLPVALSSHPSDADRIRFFREGR